MMEPQSRLEYLIEQYVSGEITQEESESLLNAIQMDSQWAIKLMEHLDLKVMLGELCQSDDFIQNIVMTEYQAGCRACEVGNSVDKNRSYRRKTGKGILTVAASLLLLLAGGAVYYLFTKGGAPEQQVATETGNGTTALPPEGSKSPEIKNIGIASASSPEEPKTERNTSDVAYVRVVSHVVWDETTEIRANEGDTIEAGWMRFHSGTIALVFFSGANVVIDGPAEFQVISPDRAYCANGQVIAEIPPQAIGFQIDVPQTKLIDLGTSFGINVHDKEATIHVIQGEVELRNPHVDRKLLNVGEAVVVKNQGEVRPFVPTPISLNPIDRDTPQRNRQEWIYWESQHRRLRKDPSIITCLDFTQNESTIGSSDHIVPKPITSGTMRGCVSDAGRFPEKKAVRFSQTSDMYEFLLPGKYDSITFATWVRIDGLEQTYNSIFTTHGFSPGEIHWHVLYNGIVELGINYDNERPCILMQTQPILLPWMRQWIHLAAVLDRREKEVRMYLNGIQVFHDTKFDMPMSFQFKNGQLGNWSFESWWNPIHQIRQLDGAVDEFIVFGRALSTKEIADLYNNNYRTELESEPKDVEKSSP